jgi:riboflavin synthase
MFTGIVEEMGRFQALDRTRETALITIAADTVLQDTRPGDSIAVNGVCLTVVELGEGRLTADVMPETLHRSGLGDLQPSEAVNLGRALPVQGRFGGHIVQGHVDATATILARDPGQDWEVVHISLPPQISRYVVEKGSIAVDGVSLTVAGVSDTEFTIALIPTTLERTTLGHKGVGAVVNLEVDVLAKYVERMSVGSAV